MDEELNKLIYENKNLIYYFVNKYKNYCSSEDLYQVGVIGLTMAYRNYKKDAGSKFSTYAYTYIMGEIKKYIREDKTIKVSKDYNSLKYKVNNAKMLLEQKLMRKVTIDDLVSYLEIDEYTLSKVLSMDDNIKSLDGSVSNNVDNLCLYDVIPDSKKVNLDDLISLRDELSKLNDYDKKILNYRYYQDKTQSEVADILGISQVKVSRYENKLLKTLKNNMSVRQ